MSDVHNTVLCSVYVTGYDDDGNMITECRNMVCARCNKCTGNNHQGHCWNWCKVTKTMRESHFCCPDDCALENE